MGRTGLGAKDPEMGQGGSQSRSCGTGPSHPAMPGAESSTWLGPKARSSSLALGAFQSLSKGSQLTTITQKEASRSLDSSLRKPWPLCLVSISTTASGSQGADTKWRLGKGGHFVASPGKASGLREPAKTEGRAESEAASGQGGPLYSLVRVGMEG